MSSPNSSSTTATSVAFASESQASTVCGLAPRSSAGGRSGNTDAKQASSRLPTSSMRPLCGLRDRMVRRPARALEVVLSDADRSRLRGHLDELAEELPERAVPLRRSEGEDGGARSELVEEEA